VSSTLTRELVDDDTLQLVRTAPVCASTSYASARGGAVLCRFAGKAGIIVLSLIEMKAFRQILRVTWTVKRTKDWVLSKAGTEPFLLQSVKKRELSYYGHVLRKEGNCTEKEIMQGITSGQRRRGRPRTRWQDNVTKWTGVTGDRLLRSVEDRRQWRKIIHEAANPRIENG